MVPLTATHDLTQEDNMTTFTTRKAPAVDHRTAYLAGWNASRRTTTADLDAAEARFMAKHGSTMHDEFVKGWTDYAADHEKWTSLPEFHPVFAASQLAYEDQAEAERLWLDGFRPTEAQCIRTHDEVVVRSTDIFGVRTVGGPKLAYVTRVVHKLAELDDPDSVMEVCVEHVPSDLNPHYDALDFGGSTEADACDEVWARRHHHAPDDLPGSVVKEQW